MQYDSYKDSGEQWLGQIPSHWEINAVTKGFDHGSGSDSGCSVYCNDKTVMWKNTPIDVKNRDRFAQVEKIIQ